VRIRTVVSVFAVATILSMAVPAFAQAKGAANVSFGYANLETIGTNGNSNVNIPAGWTASVGVGVTPMSAFVGEIGGHYKDGGKTHTFQGGLRFFSTKNPKSTPFFQVLTGLGHGSNGTVSANAWTLTPGGGVDVKINEQAAFRVQGDYLLMRNDGINTHSLRFGGSIVINLPKK
jgi:hypothetical protein